jgi:hypothetical protein
MKENKIHLVPQIVVDCAENLMNAKHDHMRDAYTMRLEAIRDYCIQALQSAQHQSNFIPPKKNSVLRDNKSKLNYSRIGRNNV